MKKIYVSIVLMALLLLCACGNTDKLDAYYTGMQSFCSNVQIITEEIDMVNADKDVSAKQISDLLDRLLEQFKTMSELQVPKNFASCEELGDDAYSYMSESVSLYKEWMGTPDNEDLLRMSKENYERALTRVNYMSIVLQGGIPEGDNISTYEEDATDFNPVTDEYSADESFEEDEDDYSDEYIEDDFSDEYIEDEYSDETQEDEFANP